MRHLLIELLHIAAGLALAVALTEGAVWAYPLGRTAIRVCGGLAMIATVVMGISPLRRAIALDRQEGER